MFKQDEMRPTILLLALLLHQGLSSGTISYRLYRYNGVAMIMERSNMYMLQLCSLDKSMCAVDTADVDCGGHKVTMCKLCNNQTNFYFSMCHDTNRGELSSILIRTTSCPAFTPTESTTKHVREIIIYRG